MGRRTRTQLPVNEKLLNPQYDGLKVQNALKENQRTQKYYYDSEAKPLQQFNPDDQIRVRNENKWELATVESKVKTPRSYVIRTERGQKLRRNRRHLMKTTENRSDCQQEVSNNNDSSSDEQSSNTVQQDDSKKYTSSGREVKLPKRYEDYSMMK